MTDRIYNLSAGPAVLPEQVLAQAQQDIWNIAGSGIGVLEHSHRGPVFTKVLETTVARCRELAGISDDYDVLFLTGGASSQFFMIPMSFLVADQTADYIVTGAWSEKAVKEAQRFGTAHIAASSDSSNFNRVPDASEISCSESPRYLHFTSNNTIFGTQFRSTPDAPAGSFLVCDASSDIFSRPIDISKHGIVYAGAQKNLSCAGAALVIIRKELIESASEDLPTMLQYRTHSKASSLYNTPPAVSIYIMGEVFKWILELGGLEAMAERNRDKAAIIYEFLDNSKFFKPFAEPDSRSQMNICFNGPDADSEAEFIAAATKAGFSGLKGHRSVGGMRASVYNAFPPEGCAKLVEFMKNFEQGR
jgi:phosphoserine aminotransferase